jgi:hypothetical protein
MALIISLIILSCSTTKNLTQQIFDGKDLSGWHIDVPAMDTNPSAKSPFIIRNGVLVSLGTPNGHIITNESHKNYRLNVEYRFPSVPGNSGILVHSSTPRALYEMFPKSLEVQLMHKNAGDFWCIKEDITVPDMEKRRGPMNEWGVDGNKKRRIINLTDNSEKPVGEWNTIIIECFEDAIKVWLNGDVVNYGTGCTAREGKIALQSEGSEVEFRKIEMRPISAISK